MKSRIKTLKYSVVLIAAALFIFMNSGLLKAQQTVYSYNFDHLNTGQYNEIEFENAIGDINFCNGADEGRVHISSVAGYGKVLDIKFPEGGVKTSGSGLNTKWYFNDGVDYEELYYSYSLYIPHDFEWATGGKLPGLGYQTSERNMSLRLMWREEGLLEFYVHYNTEPTREGYQASINWSLTNPYDSNGGPGDDQVKLKKGQWNQIKMYFKLNTPGQADGIMRGWLNGDLAIDVTDNPDMRTASEGDIKLNCMYFSAFFGTSVPSPVDTYCYFDNLLVTKDDSQNEDENPTATITSPSDNTSFPEGIDITIEVSANDADGNVEKVEFYNFDSKLGEDSSYPYSFTINNAAAGEYELTAKAIDNDNLFGKSSKVHVDVVTENNEQSAYPSGVPHSIPGTIASVNYDNGGQGIAYYDNSADNKGSGPRQDEYVDTGNENIGWIATGEWVEYTVNIEAGIYDVDVEVASKTTYGKFHIEFNGVDKTGVKSVNNTGDWGNYYDLTISDVNLSGGQQVMRIYMDGRSFNLRNITFTKQGGTTVPVTSVSLDPSSVTLNVNQTEQLNATVSPSNASNKSVTYSSDNNAVASVSNSGLVTAVSGGTATITVTTVDGNMKDYCYVTVNGGGTGDCEFSPQTSALPTINTEYTNIFVTNNGPDLSNIRKFSINWSLENNGLYVFAFNTKNGVPNWYVSMLGGVSHSLNSSQPEISISNSGFAGFDGDYYAIMDGDNFVLAEKSGAYTIYFSNSTTSPCDELKKGVLNHENKESAEFGLFPNPLFGNILNLRNLPESGKELMVVDLTGRKLIQITIRNNVNKIDLSEIEPGNYMLIILGQEEKVARFFHKY